MTLGTAIVLAFNPAETSVDAVRDQLSFYASTRAYRPVLAAHRREEIGIELERMTVGGQWDRMPALISEEIIGTFAIIGEKSEIRRLAYEKYGGLAQRLTVIEGPATGRIPRA